MVSGYFGCYSHWSLHLRFAQCFNPHGGKTSTSRVGAFTFCSPLAIRGIQINIFRILTAFTTWWSIGYQISNRTAMLLSSNWLTFMPAFFKQILNFCGVVLESKRSMTSPISDHRFHRFHHQSLAFLDAYAVAAAGIFAMPILIFS